MIYFAMFCVLHQAAYLLSNQVPNQKPQMRQSISSLQSRFNLPEKYLHFDNAYPFQTKSVVFSTTKNYQSADKESKAIFALAGRTTMTSNVFEQIWNLRSL